MFLALLVGGKHLQAQKVWDGSIADGFESGSGTKESPYEIQTPEQFAYFIQAINKGETFYEKEIVMTRDISLNNIALGANDNTCFSGTFNGLGHIIYDMYCKSSTPAYSAGCAQMFYSLEGIICNLAVQGKFASTRSSAFVKNVKSLGIIYNCNIDISMNVDAGDELFMIASNNDGSIVACSVSGNITCSKGYYWETRYNDGYYEDGIFYATLGNIFGEDYINGRNTTVGSIEQLEEWVACHPEIKKTSCDYTESTCTIEITDPEGVVVSPNISARNGISFGGISLPTTGFDCTVTGYKWRGKTLDKNAIIDREIVNVYPVYTRTIREQPTSENPTVIVDDKAHAQYSWYKVCAAWYDSWEYNSNVPQNTSKSYELDVEAGELLELGYYLRGAQTNDCLVITIDGEILISKNGNDSYYSNYYDYYFVTSGHHTIEVKVTQESTNDFTAGIDYFHTAKQNDLLVEGNTTNTLFVNSKAIEDGAEYYCVVTYSNSPTKLYSYAFVAKKDEIEGNTDITDINNTIYLNNCEASCGNTIELPIKMKNDVSATGFQFDIVLPDGITVAQDEDGLYEIELSTERTTAAKTNTFGSSLMSDGSIRVLAASTHNYAFTGNDGEVCVIKLNIGEDVPEGEYPIIIKNIEISDNKSQAYTQDYVKSTITIISYISGDANGDNKVTVTDFTAVANAILGNAPANYNVKAADVNNDGKATVSDLTGIANIILYGSMNPSSNAKSMVRNTYCAPEVYVPAFSIEPGSTIEVPVYINNGTTAFSAYQMDVNLPEGLSVSDIRIVDDRISDHVLQGSIMEDGAYRLLSYSTRGNEFIGNNGAVAVLTISADNIALGDYVGEVSEVELGENGNPHYANSSKFNLIVGDATGIMNINNDNGIQRTYNVSGIETNGMHKGVIIIKYSDGSVKKSFVK